MRDSLAPTVPWILFAVASTTGCNATWGLVKIGFWASVLLVAFLVFVALTAMTLFRR